MQVQTDGRETPEKAVDQSMADLLEEFTDIRTQFEVMSLKPEAPMP